MLAPGCTIARKRVPTPASAPAPSDVKVISREVFVTIPSEVRTNANGTTTTNWVSILSHDVIQGVMFHTFALSGKELEDVARKELQILTDRDMIMKVIDSRQNVERFATNRGVGKQELSAVIMRHGPSLAFPGGAPKDAHISSPGGQRQAVPTLAPITGVPSPTGTMSFTPIQPIQPIQLAPPGGEGKEKHPSCRSHHPASRTRHPSSGRRGGRVLPLLGEIKTRTDARPSGCAFLRLNAAFYGD